MDVKLPELHRAACAPSGGTRPGAVCAGQPVSIRAVAGRGRSRSGRAAASRPPGRGGGPMLRGPHQAGVARGAASITRASHRRRHLVGAGGRPAGAGPIRPVRPAVAVGLRSQAVQRLGEPLRSGRATAVTLWPDRTSKDRLMALLHDSQLDEHDACPPRLADPLVVYSREGGAGFESLRGVTQVPEPVSPRYRSRVSGLSRSCRSQCCNAGAGARAARFLQI